MGSPPQEVNHDDEPSAISTRTFDGRVHGPIRQRRAVRGGAGASRWPSGFACPACGCGHSSSFRREGRLYWQCTACRHQCSVISGTIFEATKLALSRWFLAMHLLTQSKNNVAALELKRHLGVCYKTAWLIKHKLMEVMRVREDTRQLDGRVEIDDAYLGGERSGGKSGRGSENKVPFVAAVQTTPEGQPQFVCLRQQPFTHEEVAVFAARSIAPSATVVSDGLWCFGAVQDRRRRPRARGHRRRQGQHEAAAVQGDQHVPGQPQARPERHLPRLRLRQVRPSLPRRGPVPIQPSLQPALHLGSPAARRLPFTPSPGARSFVLAEVRR